MCEGCEENKIESLLEKNHLAFQDRRLHFLTPGYLNKAVPSLRVPPLFP